MALRKSLVTIPVPILAVQRHYYSRNETDHCLCSNLGVANLACDDIIVNKFYQLILAWILTGSDMPLVVSSCALILDSVLRLISPEVMSKALSTCSSHIILIFFLYTGVIVLSDTHLVDKKASYYPCTPQCATQHHPSALNPMIYALRMRELRLSIQRLLGLHEDESTN